MPEQVVSKETIAIRAFNLDEFACVIPPIASCDDFARGAVTFGFNRAPFGKELSALIACGSHHLDLLEVIGPNTILAINQAQPVLLAARTRTLSPLAGCAVKGAAAKRSGPRPVLVTTKPALQSPN